MNTIVVPTDFSINAAHALRYAINIANHFGSNIHLINVYEVQSSAGMLMNVRDFIKKDAEAELSKLVHQVKLSLHHGSTLEAKALEGYPVKTICRYAKMVGADLIVMGTRGASGLKGMFLGSNASGVIKTSDLPVLAIPNAFKYKPLNKITLAIDSEVTNDAATLQPLLQLVKAYDGKIDVLHVKRAKEVALIDAGIDVFLTGVNHDFHLFDADDVNTGINQFIKKTQPDMLCMIRRERSFMEKLFHSSQTQQEAFHSPVPLLVLDDRLASKEA